MGPEPIKNSAQKGGCSETISSNCVIWDQDDVPCLGICRGMRLTDAVYKEASLVCSLLNQLNGYVATVNTPPPPINFSSLNFGCAWSPTITGWNCPGGQVFVPTGSGTPPGYCGILGSPGTGVFVPGVGWVAAATISTPVFSTVPNPTPKPSTLIAVLQTIIDAVPCCDPCG